MDVQKWFKEVTNLLYITSIVEARYALVRIPRN